jgi:CheY-like chemotaxis protein
VVAEAEDGEQAVALCARHAPDVVLMDIHMPGISGSEATRRILVQDPRVQVLWPSPCMPTRAMYATCWRPGLRATCSRTATSPN